MEHRLKYTHTSGAATVTATVTETGDGEDNRDLTIANSANQLVSLDFATANLKLFYLQSDQNVTVRTNANDGTADDSFSVSADVPLIWHDSGPAAQIFSADVTALYVQNASGVSASVKIRVLKDATP